MTHRYTFYYDSKDYRDGYDRIFGKGKSHENAANDQAGDAPKRRRKGKSVETGGESDGSREASEFQAKGRRRAPKRKARPQG